MESRQKSKTGKEIANTYFSSRDLEESHTDKEMASAHFPKSSFEHTRTIKPREFLVELSESFTYRYNNSDYEKLKEL
uniref:Uncharacterized protein n=1 Tax=Rhizophagus irregularis (strain DAOM 181602 / DAOM 197198 / MUCL 43194) TaxID=747089 RepID=U9TBX3_RHIID